MPLLYTLKGKIATVYRDGCNGIFLERKMQNPIIFDLQLPDGKYIIKNCEVLNVKRVGYLSLPKLPESEHFTKNEHYRVVYRPDNDSPSSINVKGGLLIRNKRYFTFTTAERMFITAHEFGHRHYKTEKFCDLYAVRKMLEKGFGKSVSLQTLRSTLRGDTPQNIERYNFILKELLKINY